jgi:hypothetical protein
LSLTLSEKQRLGVFKNRVLRKIFGTKRENVMEGCKNLHSKEFHDLSSLPDITCMAISKKTRWAGHVALMGECRNA